MPASLFYEDDPAIIWYYVQCEECFPDNDRHVDDGSYATSWSDGYSNVIKHNEQYHSTMTKSATKR